MLEDKNIARFCSAITAGHLHAYHAADIKKMRLSALPFA